MEKPVLLDDIDFNLDTDAFMRLMRIREDMPEVQELKALAREAVSLARPKAIYKKGYIETRGEDFVIVDGVKLTSRVLRVNLEETHRLFLFAATCGTELEAWSNPLTDLLEKYWADSIKEAALRTAIKALRHDLTERYNPGEISTMSPGSLDDWPITQQSQIFELLGDTETAIDLKLTDSLYMTPLKSISGLAFSTETSFESCQLCPRKKCPGRRAPYDPDLYESRYRNKD